MAELEGSIQESTLSDVVQFLSGSRKTGRLQIQAQDTDREGGIAFVDGSVVHAAVDELVGEEAFFELMVWDEGQFTFEPDAPSVEKTVRQSSTNLLLEGARRKDEWGVLSKHIPDMTMIPEFVLPDEDDTGQQITLNTSEWVVLSKIDGERNLQEIARTAGISEFHACRLLYPLIANKLIRLRVRPSH